MSKFNSTEKWMLDTAIKNFQTSWKEGVADATKKGKNPIFTANYVDTLIKDLEKKVRLHTLTKVLNNEKKN